MSQIKNDLLLKALRGESVPRPPVWMMRQAGRYLPDFMKLKEKYSFFDRVQNPQLATEITIMPVDQVGVDAAILFSDILVIPQAMGQEVQMVPGKGPYIPEPVRSMSDVITLNTDNAEEKLNYVMDAIRATKEALNNEVPLIGFAGAPWTILCYMVEGQGSKGFHIAKEFAFKQPESAIALLNKITDITIDYLKAKVKAGVDIVQLFDSWGGVLSPNDYRMFSLPFMERITKELSEDVPVILFAKGCGWMLPDLAATGASGLGVDWTIEPKSARKLAGTGVTLQGNFDPSRLLSPIQEIKREAKHMAEAFGNHRYIANLGHGILPNIPVDHAKAFIDTIKELG